ncbi:Hypothetical protein AJAP_42740 (plasmid) [Amycolatopsis japonica]|uniref:Uncharacterized protein n=1 Tax=Amycolatopsis japonica TaxID=208439 RepID=A0A075VEH6_9PSEU|nr:Hypothetical protein AJAP_42740 [Amycolatopsis japonica]
MIRLRPILIQENRAIPVLLPRWRVFRGCGMEAGGRGWVASSAKQDRPRWRAGPVERVRGACRC